MPTLAHRRSLSPAPGAPWATARALSLASLLLVALGCGGAGTYTTTADPVGSGQQGYAAAYSAGEAVQVEWHGSWYVATILEFRGGEQYLIHYDGWSDEWDEVVDASRIRRSGEAVAPPVELLAPQAFTDESGETIDNSGSADDPGGYTPTPEMSLQPGLRVHVEWRGRWYLAEILDAPDYGASARVHYLGWSSDWDEEVERERIRVDGAQP